VGGGDKVRRDFLVDVVFKLSITCKRKEASIGVSLFNERDSSVDRVDSEKAFSCLVLRGKYNKPFNFNIRISDERLQSEYKTLSDCLEVCMGINDTTSKSSIEYEVHGPTESTRLGSCMKTQKPRDY